MDRHASSFLMGRFPSTFLVLILYNVKFNGDSFRKFLTAVSSGSRNRMASPQPLLISRGTGMTVWKRILSGIFRHTSRLRSF